MLKFVLVWLMLVPVFIVLFVFANCAHVPVLLLHHVAVMVWLSASEQTTYSVGVGQILFCPLVGLGLFCVGIWFVVKLYVVFTQLYPSVRLRLQ